MSSSTADLNSANNSVSTVNMQRRCENADCYITQHLAQIPKRRSKAISLVTNPKVVNQPTLVDGFTTVFQLEGSSAKLQDLKDPQDPSKPSQPIYRIVPNTHAHIVNYVVVEQDGDSMRKINENDPTTMRKLLDSQRQSADQMLQKLMAGHGMQHYNSALATVDDAGLQKNQQQQQQQQQQQYMPAVAARIGNANQLPPVASAVMTSMIGGNNTRNNFTNALNDKIGNKTLATSTAAGIHTPMRSHPNLQITAVSGGEAAVMGMPRSVATAAVAVKAPIITPVPIMNLQTPSQPQPQPLPMPALPMQNIATNELPADVPKQQDGMDKMKAELEELRRTVALLAEAQAKSQQQPAANSKQAISRKR